MTFNKPLSKKFQQQYQNTTTLEPVEQVIQQEKSEEETSIIKVDNHGFQAEESSNQLLFNRTTFEMPGFANEHIKFLLSSKFTYIIVTETNKVYRWRTELDEQCVECKFEKSEEFGLGKIGELVKINRFIDQGKKVDVIDRAILDFQGYHCFLCSNTGDNYYLNYYSDTVKKLKNLREVIRTAAFPTNCAAETTGYFTLGTDDGEILFWKLDSNNKGEIIEGNLRRKTIMLPPEQNGQPNPVYKMNYFVNDIQQTALILVANQAHVFCYVATTTLDQPEYFQVFQSKYTREDKLPRFDTNKGISCQFQIFCKYLDLMNINLKPHSFIYSNGYTLHLFTFPPSNQPIRENFLLQKDNTQQLQYKKTADDIDNEFSIKQIPINIGITEYHYFLLFDDSLTIISNITQKIVHRIELTKMGKIIGMTYNTEYNIFLIYSKTQIVQINLQDEDKDVWKLYFDMKKYKDAYEITKKNNFPQSKYIGWLYSDWLFEQESYQEAAQMFFETDMPFEQAVLKFLNSPNQTFDLQKGFETYLQLWFKYYEQFKNEYQQQKYILISQIVEVKLNGLKQLKLEQSTLMLQKSESEKNPAQFKVFNDNCYRMDKIVKDYIKDFQNYLENQIMNLSEHLVQLICQLMQSHDEFELCKDFALKNNAFDLIITHFINEESYEESIKNICKIQDSNKKNEILYKYFYLFMNKLPELTIKSLMENEKQYDYEPSKLISGLMSINKNFKKNGITFLFHCIDKLKQTDKTLHNVLIFFLTDNPDEEEQKQQQIYLEKQEKKEKVNFDLDFALRRFERTKQIDSLIRVYSMMGLNLEAVSLALKHNKIELAKHYAQKPDNQEIKKKLLLQIAVYLLEKQGADIQEVIKLTQEGSGNSFAFDQSNIQKSQGLLKIEDLLPYFNENIKIEHFKDQICDSLESYNQEIDNLQREMRGYAENADQLKQEIRQINNRYIEIDQNHKCEECSKSMLSEEFYIFPCMHGFHKSCLMQKTVEQQCEQKKYEELKKLDKEIKFLEDKLNKQMKAQPEKNTGMTMVFSLLFSQPEEVKQNPGQIAKDEQELKQKKEKFDSLLIKECIYCGPKIVDQIQIPFEQNEKEKESWKI